MGIGKGHGTPLIFTKLISLVPGPSHHTIPTAAHTWQIIHERDPSLPHHIVLLLPIMLNENECFQMVTPPPENSLDHLLQRG